MAAAPLALEKIIRVLVRMMGGRQEAMEELVKATSRRKDLAAFLRKVNTHAVILNKSNKAMLRRDLPEGTTPWRSPNYARTASKYLEDLKRN